MTLFFVPHKEHFFFFSLQPAQVIALGWTSSEFELDFFLCGSFQAGLDGYSGDRSPRKAAGRWYFLSCPIVLSVNSSFESPGDYIYNKCKMAKILSKLKCTNYRLEGGKFFEFWISHPTNYPLRKLNTTKSKIHNLKWKPQKWLSKLFFI